MVEITKQPNMNMFDKDRIVEHVFEAKVTKRKSNMIDTLISGIIYVGDYNNEQKSQLNPFISFSPSMPSTMFHLTSQSQYSMHLYFSIFLISVW